MQRRNLASVLTSLSLTYTEEKAKVVAAARGTVLLQFLVTQAIWHQEYLKYRIILSYSSNRPGAFHQNLVIVLMQKS